MSFIIEFKLENRAIFEETQRFRQWWLWLMVTFVIAVLTFKQFTATSPVQASPALLAVMVGIALLLWLIKLEMKISSEGVLVRLFPFHLAFKNHSWETISRAEVQKYSPIFDYGGWGYRIGFGGKALNISGNMGLQLHFTNGKKLLIGTQRPDELRSVLQQLGRT
jgi:hypothetical protein